MSPRDGPHRDRDRDQGENRKDKENSKDRRPSITSRGSSSHTKPSSSQTKSGSSRYPKQWSEWVWDDEYQHWWSKQEIARDRYVFEYLDKNKNPIAAPPSVSRDDPLLMSRSPPSSGQYLNQDQYTSRDSVSQLADNIANASLEEPTFDNIPKPQAHLYTEFPNEEEESFDPRYRTHEAWQFKWGKVFKTLWSEPKGSDAKGGTVYSEREHSQYGEKFVAKVRRFVIIDRRQGHCICLPIMTYGGKGCLKSGIQREDHAVIYSSSQPIPLPGEERMMTKKPIKVKPYTPRDKLETASRLNYAKVYTIEYNVKVWFIGDIHKDSQADLIAAYNLVHPPLHHARGNETIEEGRALRSQPYPSSSHGSTTYHPEGQRNYDRETRPDTFRTPSAFNLSGGSSYQQRSSSTYGSGNIPGVATTQLQPVRTSASYPRRDSHARPAYDALSGGSSNEYYRSQYAAPTAGYGDDYPPGTSNRYRTPGTGGDQTSGGQLSYYQPPSAYGSGGSSSQYPPTGQTSQYPPSPNYQAGDDQTYDQSSGTYYSNHTPFNPDIYDD